MAIETGAGYFSRLFEDYAAVGTHLSNYVGEVSAVKGAIEKLEKISPPTKAVLLIDSQAAIRNLSCNSDVDCQRTVDCRL